MKALSLRQPWATAVLQGKNIENRIWNTHFRGDFLIHAAKGCTADEYDDALTWIALSAQSDMPFPESVKGIPRGGIIGLATLVGVIPPYQTPLQVPRGIELRWWMKAQYGFMLTNIRPVPFVPCNGALGFWDVPEHVMAQLHHVWTAERATREAEETRKLGA